MLIMQVKGSITATSFVAARNVSITKQMQAEKQGTVHGWK